MCRNIRTLFNFDPPATSDEVRASLAGTGLDSVIAAQKNSYQQCLASGEEICRMVFDPSDVLTPQLIAALVGLGLLALIPAVVKRWRAHARAVT